MTDFKEWWAQAKGFVLADIEKWSIEDLMRFAYASALPEWKTFETAPKDGRSFLIKVGATVLVSRYSDEILVVTGDLPKGEHKWYWAELPGMVEEGEECD